MLGQFSYGVLGAGSLKMEVGSKIRKNYGGT